MEDRIQEEKSYDISSGHQYLAHIRKGVWIRIHLNQVGLQGFISYIFLCFLSPEGYAFYCYASSSFGGH
jgi:hypothetical protein